MEVAERYFARLQELQSSAVQLEGAIQARSAAIETYEGDVEALLEKFTAVQDETTAAIEELRTLEAERASLKALFDRASAKMDSPQFAECRKNIADAERRLMSSDRSVLDLDRSLQTTSKTYKTERESRQILMASLATNISALHAHVAERAASESADADVGAAAHVRALFEISHEREASIRQLRRQGAHGAALVELLQDRLVELRAEGARAAAAAREECDAALLAEAEGRQAEREALIQRLQDMRETHESQLSQLRELKVTFATPARARHSNVGASTPSTTPTERALIRRHEDLLSERRQLTDRLAAAQEENRRLGKLYADVKAQLENDEKSHVENARRLERLLLRERRQAAQLEEENAKLVEACKTLSVALHRNTIDDT